MPLDETCDKLYSQINNCKKIIIIIYIIIIIIIIIIITILNGLVKVARHYNNKIFNAVFLYGGFLPRL